MLLVYRRNFVFSNKIYTARPGAAVLLVFKIKYAKGIRAATKNCGSVIALTPAPLNSFTIPSNAAKWCKISSELACFNWRSLLNRCNWFAELLSS